MSTSEHRRLIRPDAEDWLYGEAALLDEWRLDEWLGLFTPSGSYVVPTGMEEPGPGLRTSLINDDRRLLAERVWRLTEGPAHAQIPRSQTRRFVTNVIVDPEPDADATIVRSNFLILETRKSQQRTFGGRYVHAMVSDGAEGWKVERRVAFLDNSTLPLFNLSIIV